MSTDINKKYYLKTFKFQIRTLIFRSKNFAPRPTPQAFLNFLRSCDYITCYWKPEKRNFLVLLQKRRLVRAAAPKGTRPNPERMENQPLHLTCPCESDLKGKAECSLELSPFLLRASKFKLNRERNKECERTERDIIYWYWIWRDGKFGWNATGAVIEKCPRKVWIFIVKIG